MAESHGSRFALLRPPTRLAEPPAPVAVKGAVSPQAKAVVPSRARRRLLAAVAFGRTRTETGSPRAPGGDDVPIRHDGSTPPPAMTSERARGRSDGWRDPPHRLDVPTQFSPLAQREGGGGKDDPF